MATRKRKTNRRMLEDRLTRSYVDRLDPEREEKLNTSHMQSMAQHFFVELEALSKGARECKDHPDLVEGVCPICRGIWVKEK